MSHHPISNKDKDPGAAATLSVSLCRMHVGVYLTCLALNVPLAAVSRVYAVVIDLCFHANKPCTFTYHTFSFEPLWRVELCQPSGRYTLKMNGGSYSLGLTSETHHGRCPSAEAWRVTGLITHTLTHTHPYTPTQTSAVQWRPTWTLFFYSSSTKHVIKERTDEPSGTFLND